MTQLQTFSVQMYTNKDLHTMIQKDILKFCSFIWFSVCRCAVSNLLYKEVRLKIDYKRLDRQEEKHFCTKTHSSTNISDFIRLAKQILPKFVEAKETLGFLFLGQWEKYEVLIQKSLKKIQCLKTV